MIQDQWSEKSSLKSKDLKGEKGPAMGQAMEECSWWKKLHM